MRICLPNISQQRAPVRASRHALVIGVPLKETAILAVNARPMQWWLFAIVLMLCSEHTVRCRQGTRQGHTKQAYRYLRIQALKMVTTWSLVVTLYWISYAAAEPLPSPRAGRRAPVRMEAGPKFWTDDSLQPGVGDHRKLLEGVSPGKAVRAPVRVLLQATVADAVKRLSLDGGVDVSANNDRLAMVVLLTDLHYKKSDRLGMLRANIRLVQRHLWPTTPAVLYVFTFEHHVPAVQSAVHDLLGTPTATNASGSNSSDTTGSNNATVADSVTRQSDGGGDGTGTDGASQLAEFQGDVSGGAAATAALEAQQNASHVGHGRGGTCPDCHVHVLPISNATWVLPAAGSDRSKWYGHWGAGYRLMGDWRLVFMPRFARAMGHRYVMQWDDDSYVTGPVPYDLVRHMREGGYVLGARRLMREHAPVVWGLAELIKYFLLTHKVEPTTLFKHCTPSSLEGLYSSIKANDDSDTASWAQELDPLGLGVPSSGGWDREVLNGNCLVIDLDFWFQPLVQSLVELCRASGGSVQYRWNEQGVVGMVRHVFVRDEQLALLDFPYTHKGRARAALRAGGLKP